MINNIIPTPKKVELAGGVTELPFAICCVEEEWSEYVDTLSEAFEKLFGRPLSRSSEGITLEKVDTLPHGSYRLDSRDGALLSASDKEGILYAMASLLLAAKCENGRVSIERALIEDYPDKDYRAVMVDLAREWHPADTVLKYIDLCFILKIKYLHLHFIDDQLYTLPSKAFPHITDGSRHYTYEELAEVRSHANAKGVIIVPEFEAPGHAASLNRSYPEVFANELDGEGDSLVTEGGAVITARNLVCAGKKEAMEGIKTLIAEICELFPETPYIHIGGDEANIKAWNYCAHCKAYMEENGIEDVYELYSEFVGRVARIVLDMGKTPIVWEGFPKKGVDYIPKETIVIAWESHYHMAYDLLDAGFRIINGSWQPLYIVPGLRLRWGIREILDWNIYNWQHWWEKSEATLNPINVAPTDRVIGAQLSVWECTFEQEIGRAMENLTALSERIWNVRRLWNEEEFINRATPTVMRVARYIQSV